MTTLQNLSMYFLFLSIFQNFILIGSEESLIFMGSGPSQSQHLHYRGDITPPYVKNKRKKIDNNASIQTRQKRSPSISEKKEIPHELIPENLELETFKVTSDTTILQTKNPLPQQKKEISCWQAIFSCYSINNREERR